MYVSFSEQAHTTKICLLTPGFVFMQLVGGRRGESQENEDSSSMESDSNTDTGPDTAFKIKEMSVSVRQVLHVLNTCYRYRVCLLKDKYLVRQGFLVDMFTVVPSNVQCSYSKH